MISNVSTAQPQYLVFPYSSIALVKLVLRNFFESLTYHSSWHKREWHKHSFCALYIITASIVMLFCYHKCDLICALTCPQCRACIREGFVAFRHHTVYTIQHNALWSGITPTMLMLADQLLNSFATDIEYLWGL